MVETILRYPNCLRKAIDESGLTVKEVAEGTMIPLRTLFHYCTGQVPIPRKRLETLAAFIGYSAHDLVPSRIGTSNTNVLQSEDKQVYRYVSQENESALDKLRLNCIMYDWVYSKKPSGSYVMLQYRLSQELEDGDSMINEPNKQQSESVNEARRDALRRLALVPIYALGLGSIRPTPSWAPEDLLTHCAAGITACGSLSKGQHEDMSLAFSVLSTYLPPLKEIVDQSSLHRKEAARLVAQALHIKSALSVHREGPKRAASYEKQAVIYSKESGDILLQLVITRRLAWTYFCDKQGKKALETALQAQNILEHTDRPIPQLIHSAVYAGIAPHQAQNGQEDAASLTFHRANEKFIADLSVHDGDPSIIQFDLSDLFNDGGLTYYHLEQYDEAFKLFAQVIDTETLMPKLPISSEVIRIEILNRQALTSLKSPKKDIELSMRLWKAGMQGAIDLHSEQRFSEALVAYDIMQALWPGDRRIRDLRDLTRHW